MDPDRGRAPRLGRPRARVAAQVLPGRLPAGEERSSAGTARRKRPRRRAALLSAPRPSRPSGTTPDAQGAFRHLRTWHAPAWLRPLAAKGYSSPRGALLHAWGWSRPCLDTAWGGGGGGTRCRWGTLPGGGGHCRVGGHCRGRTLPEVGGRCREREWGEAEAGAGDSTGGAGSGPRWEGGCAAPTLPQSTTPHRTGQRGRHASLSPLRTRARLVRAVLDLSPRLPRPAPKLESVANHRHLISVLAFSLPDHFLRFRPLSLSRHHSFP